MTNWLLSVSVAKRLRQVSDVQAHVRRHVCVLVLIVLTKEKMKSSMVIRLYEVCPSQLVVILTTAV